LEPVKGRSLVKPRSKTNDLPVFWRLSAMSLDASLAPRLLPTFVAMFIALGAAGPRASGQAPDRPAANEDDRAARLAEMKQIAGTFHAAAIDGGTRTPVAQVPSGPGGLPAGRSRSLRSSSIRKTRRLARSGRSSSLHSRPGRSRSKVVIISTYSMKTFLRLARMVDCDGRR
jgi:hypothetical protein